MKSVWKKLVRVVFPLTGITTFFGSCTSTPTCNNDACYDRQIASVDPYRDGEVAAWGKTEKEELEKDRRDQKIHARDSKNF